MLDLRALHHHRHRRRARLVGDAAAGRRRLGRRQFRRGGDELIAAWRAAGPLTARRTLPGMGEVPARFPVDMQIAELAVHAWDLARATGQKVDFDPEIAEAALAWMRTALVPAFRGSEADGKSFGPEVAGRRRRAAVRPARRVRRPQPR